MLRELENAGQDGPKEENERTDCVAEDRRVLGFPTRDWSTAKLDPELGTSQ